MALIDDADPGAPTEAAGSGALDATAAAASTTRPAPEGLARGATIGRYLVLDRVGAGGMGVVFTAYDPELDRKVALKLLRAAGTADARVRLVREAQAMAKLAHPNVVTVHDVGSAGDRVFVAMELVEGETLARWLTPSAPARRDFREVLAMFEATGRGLAAAHEAGLVHRDFKPDNVIVGRDGRPRVLDFGLARALADADEPPPPAEPLGDTAVGDSRGVLATPLTRTGALMGTPAYMAPEQLRGAATDARTDQFSFCVALYEGLYGERPFAGDSLLELSANVLHGRVREPPRGTPVPVWLRRVLLRALAVDPQARHPSMAALLVELGRDPAARRRRALVGAGMAAMLVLGGLGVRHALDKRRLFCSAGPEKLAGVWDETRRESIRTALLATGKPFAADAWRGVERAFDGYAASFQAGYVDACEATHRRGEQSETLLDLRMGCLRGRLQAMQALGEVLATADAKVAEKAVQAARALPPLESCADVAALQSAVRPPDDPTVRAAVDATRADLARAKALMDAGKYKEGVERAGKLLAAARATGHRPLEAEVLVVQGTLLRLAGELEPGRAALLAAVDAGESSRQDEAAARAAADLVFLVGYRMALHAEGHALAGHAGSLLARLGHPAELEARLANALGTIANEEGKYVEARTQHERALDLRSKALGPDHPDVAASLNNLGLVLDNQGKPAEARATHERALALRERVLGPDHPEVAVSLGNLAIVLEEQGLVAEARLRLERAVSIEERALGPEHPDLAIALNNLGNMLEAEGNHAAARARYERALAIREKALGPEHPSVATTLNNLGVVQREEGDRGGARVRFERALAIREKALGPGHPTLGFPLDNLGELARAEGKPAEALARYQRALAIREKALGPRHPALASSLTGLGLVHLAGGHPKDALPLLERALLVLQHEGTSPDDLAATRFALARALSGTGDRARAASLAADAQTFYAAAGPRHARDLAEVRAFLAR